MVSNFLLRDWLAEFFPFLTGFLPIWSAIWGVCLLLIMTLSHLFKPRLRPVVSLFDRDSGVRAHGLRYRVHQEESERSEELQERTLLSWFFRFWTNFASAPSLSVLAFAIPIWFFSQRLTFEGETEKAFQETQRWLLPLFCYFGSMGLSYVLKRHFKRPRPERRAGAFGHRLKDGSFPSGHSLTAFCFWIPMVFVVASQLPILLTGLFAAGALLIVLLTGTSRIYMAVHWASDVLGGFAIGTIWTALFLLFCHRWFL